MTEPTGWTGGFGIVGLGVAGEPSKHRTMPEMCPVAFHPPVTYNPQMDRTWCLCGSKTWAGNKRIEGVACCDGPLTERTSAHV